MNKSSSKSQSLNDKLIDKLVSDRVVKSQSVESVMRKIDRGDFTGGNYAYYDSPSGIGCAATISAPHMHAWALVIEKLIESLKKRFYFVGNFKRSFGKWDTLFRCWLRKWLFDSRL